MQKNVRERTAQPLSFPHRKESQRAVLDSHQIPFSMPQHHYIRYCLYDNTDNFHVLIDNPNVFIEAFYISRQVTPLLRLPKYRYTTHSYVSTLIPSSKIDCSNNYIERFYI